MMMIQMSFNVFGSLDILPFTGVTFPFVSVGGSSLLSSWAMLAYIKATDTRKNSSFVVKSPTGIKDRNEFTQSEREDELTGDDNPFTGVARKPENKNERDLFDRPREKRGRKK